MKATTWLWLKKYVALSWLAIAALSVPVQGQADLTQSPASRPPREVQAEVRDVDSFRRLLTLEDGTQLSVPRTVLLPGGIVEGTVVKAHFKEHGGQNVVTVLEVQRPDWGRQTVEDSPQSPQ